MSVRRASETLDSTPPPTPGGLFDTESKFGQKLFDVYHQIVVFRGFSWICPGGAGGGGAVGGGG